MSLMSVTHLKSNLMWDDIAPLIGKKIIRNSSNCARVDLACLHVSRRMWMLLFSSLLIITNSSVQVSSVLQ